MPLIPNKTKPLKDFQHVGGIVGVKSLLIVIAQSLNSENAQCNFEIAQIPRLHGTETLDLSQCNRANPYDTMEPELSPFDQSAV